MLWSEAGEFNEEPFDLEADLEEAMLAVSQTLFGKTRIYIDTQKKIGGGRRNPNPSG
ncbi:MAG: hypothetical protein ABSD28_13515 [Tepidisphaeraceae bacterium]|jgi:hypothetical protein